MSCFLSIQEDIKDFIGVCPQNKVMVTTVEPQDALYTPPCWLFSEMVGSKLHVALKIGVLFGGHPHVLEDYEVVEGMFKHVTPNFQLKSNLGALRGYQDICAFHHLCVTSLSKLLTASFTLQLMAVQIKPTPNIN